MRRLSLFILLLFLVPAPVFAQDEDVSRLRIGTSPNLPDARQNVDYSLTFQASGGLQPYRWTIASGRLPAGLELGLLSGQLNGRPTEAGDFSFQVGVLSFDGQTDARGFRLRVSPVPALEITTTSLPPGTVGVPYAATLSATGGIQPYTWSVSSGSLPPGVTVSAAGAISGTPSAAGTFGFEARVIDGSGNVAARPLQVVVSAPVAIATTTLAGAQVGVAYSEALVATGGVPPYTWTMSAGSLPAGLQLAPGGTISGTPTAAGTVAFTVRAADSGGGSATRALQIVVAPAPPPPVSITTSSLPNGEVGTAYSQTLTATGGTPPYTWALATGALPSGLSLAPSGTISGMPSTAGNSSFGVMTTDSAGKSATRDLTVSIAAAPVPPVSITTSSLPNGQVGSAYSQTLSATGGTPPYTWAVASGALPAGLSLALNGTIAGTPSTAGNSSFGVRATDSAGKNATRDLSISIAEAPPPPVSITSSSLPNGQAGTAYSQTLTAAGGTPPYTWVVASGALPAGLSLAPNGTISGTPSSAGSASFSIRASDSAGKSATRDFSISITAAPVPPSITTSGLPAGRVGADYSQTLGATGGTPPYTWALAGGSLPAGLTLAPSGTISGRPTTAGTSSFSVRVSDSAGQNATRDFSLSVTAAPVPLSVSTTGLPEGQIGAAYAQTLSAAGGTQPYSWTLASGSLPAGLTLAPSGSITGSPTAAGTSSFTARVSDSAGQNATRELSIAIAAAATPPSIVTPSLPNGQVGVPYSQTLTASAGKEPYSWTLAAGSLPPGLALAPNGSIAGSPLTSGTYTFSVRVADAAGQNATGQFSITISTPIRILTEALPDGTTQASYSSVLTATGGTGPYRWTTIAGAIPPGLSLDETTGIITGRPAAMGDFFFTARVTEAGGSFADKALAIRVSAALAIPSCPTATASSGRSYTSTVTAIGGQAPYTWTVGAGALPQGLTLDGSGTISGTPSAAGQADFSLAATDAVGASTTRPCRITVAPPLSVTSSALSGGTIGAAYEASLSASGGTPPYVWSIAAGALPPGLSLNSATGQITGVATQGGTFRFTVRASDAVGTNADLALSIDVAASFAITQCPTPAAIAGEAYSSGLAIVGGESPVEWAITSGSLPAGLTLDTSTGTVTGTPDQPGTSDFVIRVQDRAKLTTTRACSIVVGTPGLRISAPDLLPDAVLGEGYGQGLQAIGGSGSYRWAVADGSLPEGLALSADGRIQGVPQQTGVFSVTVRVLDGGAGVATRAFTLRVIPAAAPSLSFGDLPEIIAPAQQPRVRLSLGSSYPVDLRGRISMTFTPDPGLNVDDKSIQFAAGGRTSEFRIPGGSTDIEAPIAMQTGTVAGTIELRVELLAGDLDVTPSPAPVKRIRIDRTAPVISSVRVNRIDGGIEVIVTGYSTTRDVSTATFVFTPAPGSRLETSQISVNTEAAARQWYSNPASAEFGSQFTFTQPFMVSGASLAEVSLTLTNGQGTSAASQAQF